jgi:hypothetical protein
METLGLGNDARHRATGTWFAFTAIKLRTILGALLQKERIWRCVQTQFNLLTSSIWLIRIPRRSFILMKAASLRR